MAQVQLTIYQPNLPPARRWFAAEQTITLGRATECSIPIKDRFLSRKHAEIVFASGDWIVRDCGSVNGTLLNGVKVVGTAVIR
ncbi:MAG TPA: FHA domain-containing protein, partial [Thermoanaerobaculia bacterium]